MPGETGMTDTLSATPFTDPFAAADGPTAAAPTAADQITAAAIDSFDGCADPRLRQIMRSLVRHLHAFAQDVQLTEDGWTAAIGILTATGHITDESARNSSCGRTRWGCRCWSTRWPTRTRRQRRHRVDGARPVLDARCADARLRREHRRARQRHAGPGLRPRARITDGAPIAGALLDIWQNGDNGLYTVQDAEAPEAHLRGRFLSREDGSYAFVGVRPVPYTIPHDGPVGSMIEATNRHPWRPAHIHMIVTAPGYQRLQTHIFDSESPYLSSDAVFAVKPSLIRNFAPRAADDPDRPAGVNGPWCSVANDIVLGLALRRRADVALAARDFHGQPPDADHEDGDGEPLGQVLGLRQRRGAAAAPPRQASNSSEQRRRAAQHPASARRASLRPIASARTAATRRAGRSTAEDCCRPACSCQHLNSIRPAQALSSAMHQRRGRAELALPPSPAAAASR